MGAPVKSIAVYSVTLVFIVSITGCTSPKYKLVREKEYQPPTAINLPVANRKLEARLDNLIYHNGPGSWKVNAVWDEYVFTILNRSDIKMKIVNIYLVDPLDRVVNPAQGPRELIKNNSENMKLYKEAGIQATYEVDPLIVAGVIAGLAALEVGAAVGTAAGLASLSGVTGLYALGAAVFIVLPAILLIGAGTMIKNDKAKKLIDQEFEKRDLDFPITLGPGELVQGSVFYPIVPSPQSFNISYQLETGHGFGELLYLQGSLDAFKGLHEILPEDEESEEIGDR